MDLEALEVRFEGAVKAYVFHDHFDLSRDSQRCGLLDTATGAEQSHEALTTHEKRLFRAVPLHERARQFSSSGVSSSSTPSAPSSSRLVVAHRRFAGRSPPIFAGSAPRGMPPRGSPGLRQDASGCFQPGCGGAGRAQVRVKSEHAKEAYGDEPLDERMPKVTMATRESRNTTLTPASTSRRRSSTSWLRLLKRLMPWRPRETSPRSSTSSTTVRHVLRRHAFRFGQPERKRPLGGRTVRVTFLQVLAAWPLRWRRRALQALARAATRPPRECSATG